MQPNLKVNIAVNLIARVWNALITFAVVPVYIYFIGTEGYGFISLYATLVALFALLDFGISVTINREMARFGETERSQARTLFRTFEAVYWVIAALIGLGIALASDYIVNDWITLNALPVEQAQRGIQLMGLVALVRWPTSLYLGVLLGMQRQVIANVITSLATTLASAGAALILWLVSPRVDLFVGWQLIAFAIQIVVLRAVAWRTLALPGDQPRIRLGVLRESARFSAGVTGITLISLLLSQVDKLLLTRLVPLQDYGYYTIATGVAGILTTVGAAVQTAAFPALTNAVEAGDTTREADTYHKSSRVIAVLVLPAAIGMVLFAPQLLTVYLHDPVTTERTHLLLSILAVGSGGLALLYMPLSLQLAHGWTSLSIYKNILAAVFYIPLLFFLLPRYGTLGSAVAWVGLIAGYFLLEVPTMHRRLLREGMWRWYLVDLGRPALLALAVMSLTWLLLPDNLGLWPSMAFIVAGGALAQLGCFWLLPDGPAIAHRALATIKVRLRRQSVRAPHD